MDKEEKQWRKNVNVQEPLIHLLLPIIVVHLILLSTTMILPTQVMILIPIRALVMTLRIPVPMIQALALVVISAKKLDTTLMYPAFILL
jgi:hypothetical protein